MNNNNKKIKFNTPSKSAPKSTDQPHQKLISELQSTLECPVCLETIRTAPVKCCDNGHIICNACHSRVDNCPTCRGPMGNGVSDVANKLIDLLPHPCANQQRGCQVEGLLAELTRHETECEYRGIRCPLWSCICKQKLSMSQLYDHLEEEHGREAKTPKKLPLKLRYRNFDNGLEMKMVPHAFFWFMFDGRQFFVQTIASPDKTLLYNFVQIEGNKTDCNKYSVKITLKPGDESKLNNISVTMRPNTLDQHCEDDLQNIDEVLVTTKRMMDKMIQYDENSGSRCFKMELDISLDN